MTATRPSRFVLLLLPPLLVAAALLARGETLLRSGVAVALRVVPRDPFHPLQGRSMALELEIESLERASVPGPLPGPLPRPIYVRLWAEGDVHRASEYAFERPPASASPFVRGRLVAHDEATGVLRVEYDFDQFFVANDAIEPSQDERVLLHVRVHADGRAVAEELTVDGVPFRDVQPPPR